jgi:hypothetical protein
MAPRQNRRKSADRRFGTRPANIAAQEVQMRRTSNHGASSAVAIAFAALPLMVMSWVAYESALTAFA